MTEIGAATRAGWLSIWSLVLEQASMCAAQAVPNKHTRVPASLSAIVLARVAWEAFVNEFIQWRGLAINGQSLSFRSMIVALTGSLDLPPPQFDRPGLWTELDLLNDLRNELVHHKASIATAKDGPRKLLARLRSINVLDAAIDSPSAWEQQILSFEVAKWSCSLVGAGILHLEGSSKLRTRSKQEVGSLVKTALRPLGGQSARHTDGRQQQRSRRFLRASS